MTSKSMGGSYDFLFQKVSASTAYYKQNTSLFVGIFSVYEQLVSCLVSLARKKFYNLRARLGMIFLHPCLSLLAEIADKRCKAEADSCMSITLLH